MGKLKVGTHCTMITLLLHSYHNQTHAQTGTHHQLYVTYSLTSTSFSRAFDDLINSIKHGTLSSVRQLRSTLYVIITSMNNFNGDESTVQTTYLISLTSLQFIRRASTRTFTPSLRIRLQKRLHVNIITLTVRRLNNVQDTNVLMLYYVSCVYTHMIIMHIFKEQRFPH